MKLNKNSIALRYGKAIFELAEEDELLNEVQEDFLALKQIFEENETLGEALSDIRLTYKQKQTIFQELKKDAHPLTQNFLSVVFESNLMFAMPLILENFFTRYNKEKGIVTGVVTSAVPLSAAQKAQITVGLAKRLKIGRVTLTEKIDETIVGGVIVEANGQIIDGSIRTQLMKLKNLLKQV
ncbi:ATP synthase F1 subunit delta [Pilibacter termitis]|uniref:ATP synthase F1 subunit delta n=1 Tax=Pilibacter termitis TaxID=263852 RepID=UPI001356484A|nr:ATP synthase F1 subunit delta [Pilibacter termitis]